jgi:hypothetical protein
VPRREHVCSLPTEKNFNVYTLVKQNEKYKERTDSCSDAFWTTYTNKMQCFFVSFHFSDRQEMKKMKALDIKKHMSA